MRMSLFFLLWGVLNVAWALPSGFVYLRDVDPSIMQDMRYAGSHNFIGRPIKGYERAECILTTEAASALVKVQAELKRSNLSLKVYDCYRPVRAVADFWSWSQHLSQQEMKAEFYPNVNKADFFKLGYVAKKSGHNRGSTIDLTIVPLGSESALYQTGQALSACTEVYKKRFQDNSIDMGTGYDCMDKRSHIHTTNIAKLAFENRIDFRQLMEKYGFEPYEFEWWHFTLKNEPFPDTYFDFPVK